MIPLAYGGTALGVVLFVLLIVFSIAAWVTHVMVCLMSGAFVLLIVGALFAPIGIIHGYMTWFGYSIVIYAF